MKKTGKFFQKMLGDIHNETCMCRRCRARVDAMERRPIRLDSIRNWDDVREITEVTEEYNE